MSWWFKHTPLEDILYFTKFWNLSDFSIPSQLAGLLNAADKSIRNNPTSWDIVFLFGKIPLEKVKKEDRWGYPIQLDENNYVIEKWKLTDYKNVFLTNNEPVTQRATWDYASASDIKKTIDYLLGMNEFVKDIARLAVHLECSMDNLMFKHEDPLFEKWIEWPETWKLDPLVAWIVLESCVQESPIKDPQKYINSITLAKEYYSVVQKMSIYLEGCATVIEILGDDYLENIETTLKVLQDQIKIQENKEKLRINSVHTIEKQLGVRAEDIDIEDEVEKINGLKGTWKNKLSNRVFSDKWSEGINKLILKALAGDQK